MNETHTPMDGIFMYHYVTSGNKTGIRYNCWVTTEWIDLTPKIIGRVAKKLNLPIDNGRFDLSFDKIAYLKLTSNLTLAPSKGKILEDYAYIGSGDGYEVGGAVWTVGVGLMNTSAEWHKNVESFDFYLPCAGRFEWGRYDLRDSKELYVQHIHACIEQFEDKLEAYLKHLIERFGK